MRAYVINLARSPERRAHMVRELDRVGMEHRFVAAVDGRALTAEDRRRLVDEEAVARAPTWLTPTAIGCALSHLAAYREVLAAGESHAVVLEDDVRLPADMNALVEEVAARMTNADVALLHYHSFQPLRLAAPSANRFCDDRLLATPLDPGQLVSTVAYMVTAEACSRLAATVLPVRVAADSWGFLHQAAGLSIRCVVPRPVGVRADFRSTLDHTAPDSLAGRALDLVNRHRIFPLHQLLSARRRRALRLMERIVLLDEHGEPL